MVVESYGDTVLSAARERVFRLNAAADTLLRDDFIRLTH